ncbi:unnamed protein product [Trichobilharzia regenti]|nr:unnamed protein product [Trichobilharzia regenti]
MIRSRLIQELVLNLCAKRYSISEKNAFSALDILISRGHLHTVDSPKGILYAKIIAKYSGGINGIRPEVSIVLGPKRPHSERSLDSCPSEVEQNDPTTNNVCHCSNRRSTTNSLLVPGISAINCSDNTEVGYVHVKQADKSDFSTGTQSYETDNLQHGTKIFTVLPASPMIQANSENQMINLTHYRIEKELPMTVFISGIDLTSVLHEVFQTNAFIGPPSYDSSQSSSTSLSNVWASHNSDNNFKKSGTKTAKSTHINHSGYSCLQSSCNSNPSSQRNINGVKFIFLFIFQS